ncbi:hypothetical protein AB837_00642 [bacterium AB1]|nr:hypothetical protein AB837_00642 [bacterium AB1]
MFSNASVIKIESSDNLFNLPLKIEELKNYDYIFAIKLDFMHKKEAVIKTIYLFISNYEIYQFLNLQSSDKYIKHISNALLYDHESDKLYLVISDTLKIMLNKYNIEVNEYTTQIQDNKYSTIELNVIAKSQYIDYNNNENI